MTSCLLTRVHALQYLLRDLRRLHEAASRVIAVAIDAPTLRNHKMSARRAPLERTLYGHPTLSDGRPILTRELQLHAYLEQDGEMYARTLNRWYRLQTSAGRRYRG